MPNVIQRYTRRSGEGWLTNHIEAPDRYAELPPGSGPDAAEVVQRFTLLDGDRPDYDEGGSPARERIQLQGYSILRNGSTFCASGWLRFVEHPGNSQDWLAVFQNHDHNLPQPNWLLETNGGQLYLNVPRPSEQVAGRFDRQRRGPVPYTVGQWHSVAVHWKPSLGSDGFIEWHFDGQRQWRFDGVTASQAEAGYLIQGIYRAAAINGRMVVDFCGWKLHDGLVIPGTSTPPPTDTTGPSVQVTRPVAGAAIDRNVPLDSLVEATDPSGVASVRLLLDGQPVWSEVNPPFGDGSYVIPEAVRGGEVVLRVEATDRAGNVSAVEQTNTVLPVPPPPPPPDPDPVFDVVALRALIDAARAQALAAAAHASDAFVSASATQQEATSAKAQAQGAVGSADEAIAALDTAFPPAP